MRSVGIRELKNRLSEHLRLVREGEWIQVTDRGKVIAELRPPGIPSEYEKWPGLIEMARKGKIRLGKPNASSAWAPQPGLLAGTGLTIRQIIDDMREDTV